MFTRTHLRVPAFPNGILPTIAPRTRKGGFPNPRQCYHTLGRDFVWRMTRCSGRPHFEYLDDLRKSSMTFSMPNSAAPTSPSSCCPDRGLQRRWTCPIGAVIGDRFQTVHSAQRGRAKGVRPSNGVDEP